MYLYFVSDVTLKWKIERLGCCFDFDKQFLSHSTLRYVQSAVISSSKLGSEVGIRYFKSTDDIGTNTLLKK